MERKFSTPDLYLSAAISILLKTIPDFEVKNSRILFSFDATDSLYRAMQSFNEGVSLPAIEYAETIKKLRAEMLIRKNAGKNRV